MEQVRVSSTLFITIKTGTGIRTDRFLILLLGTYPNFINTYPEPTLSGQILIGSGSTLYPYMPLITPSHLEYCATFGTESYAIIEDSRLHQRSTVNVEVVARH